MESWRKVFREGFAPSLSTPGLVALKKALEEDDPSLIQGATTTPPPLQCVLDWPVEGGCLISYTGWKGDGLETVGEVEEFFARACYDADNRLGEPAGSRWLLNWFDDMPRKEVRKLLLPEVERELRRREESPNPLQEKD